MRSLPPAGQQGLVGECGPSASIGFGPVPILSVLFFSSVIEIRSSARRCQMESGLEVLPGITWQPALSALERRRYVQQFQLGVRGELFPTCVCLNLRHLRLDVLTFFVWLQLAIP